jgi:hypothetical protein
VWPDDKCSAFTFENDWRIEMKSSTVILVVMGVLTVIGSALTAQGDIVNAEFVSSTTYQYNGITPIDNATPYTFNFVMGSTTAYTSPQLQASDGVGGALGTTTPVTVSVGDNGGIAHWGKVPDGYFAWQLFGAYHYQTAPYQNPAFSINNLVAGNSYDLYLYGQEAAFADYGASFTISNVGGGTKTCNTPGTTVPDHFVEGGNYVKYTGVVADSNGQITGSYTWLNQTNDMGFNGFTIVGSFPTPEPSTLTLLIVCLLGIVAYAWRKRN